MQATESSTKTSVKVIQAPAQRRDAAVMLGGQLFRVAVQGGYFVLLAKSLGASDYGAVAVVLALTSMLSPFSNFGAALLLLKNVSRDPSSAPKQWANATSLTLCSGVVLTFLTVLIAGGLHDNIAYLVAVMTGLSDLIFAQVVQSAVSLHQALGHMARAGLLQAFLQLSRFAGLVLLVLGPWAVTPASWAITYFCASVPTATFLWAAVIRRYGWSGPDIPAYRAEWRAGLMFSVGMSTQTIYNDIDKVFLARLSSLEQTGTYSAAYRVVDMSYVPVRSFIAVAYPEMMRAGMGGNIRRVLDVVRARLAVPLGIYCVAGGLAMAVGAGLLPAVLGSSFRGSVDSLRMLSALLPLKGLHFVAADALTTSDHQRARTLMQIFVAVLNVFLCFWLIPTHGYHGAIAASLVSDGFLAVGLWGLIGLRLRSESSRLTRDV